MLSGLIDEIASDDVLEEALAWLCKRREAYSHNDDVWEVRLGWHEIKPQLQTRLLAGSYRFSPLRRVVLPDKTLELWSARDVLVLKAMAIVLTRCLAPGLSKRCTHLAGNGGAKAAVREVVANLPGNPFVFRTDVKHYYASIGHDVLYAQLVTFIDDPRLLNLLWQYLHRTVYDGGLYEDIEQGISLGCPLSPLMGALFLDVLDKRMESSGLFYVRFMDDWIVLASTRWKLRKAVRVVNETLAELHVEQHPDKTFVGRVEHGFTFLGYEFGPLGDAEQKSAGLTGVAPPTRTRFVERMSRLYEQGATPGRIADYVRRWSIWVRSALSTPALDFFEAMLPTVNFSPSLAPLFAHAEARDAPHNRDQQQSNR